jgi:hypothetical protein
MDTSKAQLEEIFSGIKTQTNWDIKNDLLWGYFFTSPNKSELEKIGDELASDRYRFVEIRQLESDASQAEPEWLLHVERIETHSVDTLLTRNTQFEDLASRYEDVVYDGWDVGKAT